jgi:hypothetical protein
MRLVIPLSAALALAACASAPPPKQAWPGSEGAQPAAEPAPAARAATAAEAGAPVAEASAAAAPAATGPFDPVAYAKRYPRAEFCEEAARGLQRSSRDRAWAVLRACVAQGRFTLLKRLVAGPWNEDLKARPDASKLLAKVIAMRGGDVTGDLGQLRQARVPLFAIAPAVGHPDLYKGRLVLFRGEVRDVKLAGKPTAKMMEFAIGSTDKYIAEGDRYTSSTTGGGAYSNSTGYASEGSGSSTYSSGIERRFTGNEAVETGRQVLARLAEADPFFEPGRQFVVLARFDGVRDEEGEDVDTPTQFAMVSIVSYYEPSPNVVE